MTRRREAKKPSTLATDRGRIERHIKALLGNLKTSAVTRNDIERFRDAVAEGATKARIKTGKHGLARVTGGQGTATRTMGLLGAIFAFGVRRDCGPTIRYVALSAMLTVDAAVVCRTWICEARRWIADDA